MASDDPHELLSKEQVAEILEVTPRTVFNWYREGKIPYRRIGAKLIRFERQAIIDWLAAREQRNQPKAKPATLMPGDFDAAVEAIADGAHKLRLIRHKIRDLLSAVEVDELARLRVENVELRAEIRRLKGEPEFTVADRHAEQQKRQEISDLRARESWAARRAAKSVEPIDPPDFPDLPPPDFHKLVTTASEAAALESLTSEDEADEEPDAR